MATTFIIFIRNISGFQAYRIIIYMRVKLAVIKIS